MTINNRTIVRRLGRLAATGALAATAAVSAAASPAAAADLQYSYIHSNVSGGAWLRAQPNTGAYGIKYLGNGQEVLMICWTDAQWVYPPNTNYASNRWFKVEPTYDTAIGYVHSALVYNQRSVPRCS